MSSYFYSKKYVNNTAEKDSPINDASDALGQAGYSIGFHHTISGKEVYFKAFLTAFNETYNSEIGEYEGGYYPDRVDYKLDKKGFVLKYPEGHPEEGNPIPDEGFVKKGLKKISPIIRKGVNKLLNPLSDDFKVQAPPLPVTSQPKVQMASIKSPVTGLTRTESALLSKDEQEIARRT